jgi:hypothetical protein
MTPLLAVTLGDDLTMSIGVIGVVVATAVGIAQNTWHIAGLRESRAKMEQQIEAQREKIVTLEAIQGNQGLQIANILEMLGEIRADVKRLLQQSHS